MFISEATREEAPSAQRRAEVIRDVAVQGPLAKHRTQAGPGGGGEDGRTHSPKGLNLPL